MYRQYKQLNRHLGGFFIGDRMSKPEIKDTTEYTEDFEQPQDWEQLRDCDGVIMEGSYRTLPSVDSDSL